MTNRLKALQAKREEILTRMKAINKVIDAENRDFNEDENKEFDQLESDLKANKKAIEREGLIVEEMRKLKEPRKDAGQNNPGEGNNPAAKKRTAKSPEDKAKERYSITRHIRMHMRGEKLDGIEKEMQEEAQREQRASGISGAANGVKIPSMIVGTPQQRDLVAGTDNVGGYTIETELRGMIPYLYPRLKTQALGATVIPNLVGDVTFPTQATNSVAAWAAENGSASETNPTFGIKTLTPNRLTAKTHISGQLLAQSNESIDQMVARDLRMANELAVDAAVINGSGTSNQPLGIGNLAGVTTVALDTNGAAPTRQAALDVIGAVEDNNADFGKLGFLTTPGVRRTYQNIPTQTGSGIYCWDTATPNNFMGYRAEVSTQVPSNLSKGSGTNLHMLVYGNWQDFVIGNWAGIELVVDQYTLAGDNIVRLIIHSWWDMFARHDKSFAVIKDIVV